MSLARSNYSRQKGSADILSASVRSTLNLTTLRSRRSRKPDDFRPSGSSYCLRSKIRIYPTLVPHSSQNFAPGFNSCWQFEHFAGACEAPHSLQNFESAGIAAPHLTHLPAAAATPAPPEVVAPCCLIASVIDPAIILPTAKPAPSPAPSPAPPDGFCAASHMASAAWNCA